MTHWFDRVATASVAGERGITRRSALMGAVTAAFAVSPLASQTVAEAALRLEAKAAQAGCQGCLNLSILANNRDVKNCLRTGNPDGRVKRIKKGKRRGRASPVSAAQKLGCVARRHAELVEDLNGCRRNNCPGTSAPPVAADPQGAGCPSGTTPCSGDLCCYGGDVCCGCSGKEVSVICCAGVIGCTCC